MKEGWVYKKFEKCLVKVPKQKAVKTKQYLDEGLFPIVSQESSIISGYTNDEGLLYKHDKPIVIFGDHTKNIKYIDFDFVVGADGVHILLTKDDILPKFFFYELCSIKLRNLGYARHYKLLKEKNITYPSLAEQQQIVSFLDSEFEKIDALKANAEEQLQGAKDLFQKALKEMLTPKDGWEKKTLDELCDKAKNIKWSESSGTHKYVDLSSVCRDKLSITDSVDVDYRSAPSRAKQIIKSHDILFATTRPTLRRLCVVNQNFDNEICSTGFCILRPNSKVYYRFLFFNLLTDDFYKYIEPLQTGANYPAVTDGIVKQYSLLVPPTIKEQQQIADNLDALSAKIKQLQENYNETITLCNDLKQSLLKKIFE